MLRKTCFTLGLASWIGSWGITIGAGEAQIIPDGTLGSEGSVVLPTVLEDGAAAELIEGGASRGNLLFHSFEAFGISSGQRVYFANPDGIARILSRVTGDSTSQIDGLLGVRGSADLFILNPNGIVFGPNSQLDVRGSFVATTASEFELGDEFSFGVIAPEAPPLLSMNVEPGLQLGHQGSVLESHGQLVVGQDLTLVSDTVEVQGQLLAGNALQLLGNSIEIRDEVGLPFVAQSGGNLVIQGNDAVDIFALNDPASGLFAQGEMVLRSNNAVIGDAHFSSGAGFRVEDLLGQPGHLTSPNDPVIRAAGNVTLGNYEGASLHILAGGSVTAGDITITEPDATGNALQEIVTLSDGETVVEIDGIAEPTLDVRAGTLAAGVPETGGVDVVDSGVATGSEIIIGDIRNEGGIVFLTNQYEPNPNLAGGVIQTGEIDTSQVNLAGPTAEGGDVWIDSRGNVELSGDLNTFARAGEQLNILSTLFVDVYRASAIGEQAIARGGSIEIISKGSIRLDTIDTSTVAANGAFKDAFTPLTINSIAQGGNVRLHAQGEISTQDISTQATASLAVEDPIEEDVLPLISSVGNRLDALSSAIAGSVYLESDGEISSNALSLSSNSQLGIFTFYNQTREGLIQAEILAEGGALTTISDDASQFGFIDTSTNLDVAISTGVSDFGDLEFESLDIFGFSGIVKLEAKEISINEKIQSSSILENVFFQFSSKTQAGSLNASLQAGNVDILADNLDGLDTIDSSSSAIVLTDSPRSFRFLDNFSITEDSINEISVSLESGSIIVDSQNSLQLSELNSSSRIDLEADFHTEAGNEGGFGGIVRAGDGGNIGRIETIAKSGDIQITTGDNVSVGLTDASASISLIADVRSVAEGNFSNEINVADASSGDAGSIGSISSEAESGQIYIQATNDIEVDNILANSSASSTVLVSTSVRLLEDFIENSNQISELDLLAEVSIGMSGSVDEVSAISASSDITIIPGGRFQANQINASSISQTFTDLSTILLNEVEADISDASELSNLNQLGQTTTASSQSRAGNVDILLGDESTSSIQRINTSSFSENSLANTSKESFQDNQEPSDGGNILFQKNETLILESLEADASILAGNGEAGTIFIEAGTIRGADIGLNANISGSGTAGEIALIAENEISLENSRLISVVNPGGEGNGDRILLQGGSIELSDLTLIDSATFGSGTAGDIDLVSNSEITLRDSNILAITGGIGDAGAINITAQDVILEGNSTIAAPSILSAENSLGGDISITAARQIVIDGSGAIPPASPRVLGEQLRISEINEPNDNIENAQNINSNFSLAMSDEDLSSAPLADQFPSVTIEGELSNGFQLDQDSYVFNIESTGTHLFWNIDSSSSEVIVSIIDPQTLRVLGSSSQGIVALSRPGEYIIQAENPEVTPGSFSNFDYILTASLTPGFFFSTGFSSQTDSSGNAGNILVQTPSLILRNGGDIATSTTSSGDAGNVMIQPFNDESLLTISFQEGQITAETEGAGNGGNIELRASDAIDITGNGALNAQTSATGSAGNITVTTNRFTLDQGTRLTTTATETATPPANTQERTASIELNANEMNLFGTVQVLSETQGSAQAGTLTLQPNGSDNLTVNLRDQSRVSASTSSSGLGGSLLLQAPNAITVSGEGTLSAETSGSGSAGQVRVEAQEFTLENGAQLSTSTTGEGNSGQINLDVPERVTLLNGARLLAQSTDQATGSAGSINFNAANLTIRNSTITAETNSSGNAGSITFEPTRSRTLDIDFGNSPNGQITAETTSSGNGGDIILSAPDAITITGQGTLNAQTSSTGSAGQVEVTTGLLTIDQGTSLTTTATTTARPPANTEEPLPGGSIRLTADQMNLFGTITVLSQTEGEAPAGRIALNPNNSPDLTINLRDQSLVSTSSSGSGPGGSLSITAPRALTISGQGTLSAETSGSGPAGEVFVQAQQFTLQDGAEISTRTTGSGEGGTLRFDIGNGITRLRNARLIADSTQPDDTLAGSLLLQTGQFNLESSILDVRNAGNDDGGNIDIQVTQGTFLSEQSSIQTNATGTGNGGNIFMRTPFLSATPGGNNDIIANAINGNGGNITVEADSIVNFQLVDEPEPALRANTTNDISASSELGIDGTLSLEGFNVDPSQGSAELPTDFVDSSNQIRQGCNPGNSDSGSFVNAGRGGIPPQPSDPLSSHTLWEDVHLPQNWSNANSNQHPPASATSPTPAVIEAQGWNINPQGEIQLLSQKPKRTQLVCQLSTQKPAAQSTEH